MKLTLGKTHSQGWQCIVASLWLSLAAQRVPSSGASFSFNGMFVWFPSVVLVPVFP